MELKQNGLLWSVKLSHAEVELIGKVGDVLTQLPEPMITKAISAAVKVIRVADLLGGRNGVEITGVLGYLGLNITPPQLSLYNLLNRLPSLITESAEQFGDIVFKTLTYWKDKIEDGSLPFVIAFPFVLGPIVLASKLWGKLFGSSKPGGMRADKIEVGTQEKFILVHMPEEDKVALLSWRGYVRAKDGGGSSVWADKPWIRSHEKWELEHNEDGTVSLRSWNGHYFVAEDGGGKECNANQREKGQWERFWLEFHDEGVCSLRTLEKDRFVHVKK